MKTDISEKVLPIYNELQGYLSQAPKKDSGSIYEESIWKQFNQTIEELNSVTDSNYDKFKVEVKISNLYNSQRQYIDLDSYRTKLAGLISRLYGEYFSEEQMPFSVTPNTIINTSQTQVQSQQQQQSMIVDIAMMIAEKKNSYEPQTPERDFLDKFGETLKTAKDIKEIITTLIHIATTTGVGLAFLKQIFK